MNETLARTKRLDDLSFELFACSLLGTLVLMLLGAPSLGFAIGGYAAIARLLALNVIKTLRQRAEREEAARREDDNER